MADKIDQLKFGNTSYDIDLPPDATPSIASLTATTVYTSNINADTSNLTLEYGITPAGQTPRGVIFKESLSEYGVKLYSPSLTDDISIILPSTSGTLATQGWVTSQGYTTNTGTVIGSGLTANYFVVGNGTVNVKISSMQPATSSTTWSTSSDVYVPTMKAISSYVTGLGYTTDSVSGVNDGTNWTSITINGTTKSIPSGGGSAMYHHIIRVYNSNSNAANFTLLTSDSSAYNSLSLISKLSTLTNSWSTYMPLNGYFWDDSPETEFPLLYVEYTGSGKSARLIFYYKNTSYTTSDSMVPADITVTDVVKPA